MSSPSQTLSLIGNKQINQPTLKNQNETLGSSAIPKINIVSNTEDEAVNSRSGHNEIISADSSSLISEVSVPVQGQPEDRASHST